MTRKDYALIAQTFADAMHAFEIKPEADFLQALLAHRVAEFLFVAGVEHEEAAATRGDEFSAEDRKSVV